jgi:transcriptional regulator with XRE-family HTH domain
MLVQAIREDCGSAALLMRNLRADMKISQERLAGLLRVSLRTIVRHEHGERKGIDMRLYDRLVRLKEAADLGIPKIGREQFLQWLYTPNEQFDHYLPLDLLDSAYTAGLLLRTLQTAGQGEARGP